MELTDYVVVVAVLVMMMIIYILSRLNKAIKLLNSRVTILSSHQKNLTRELHARGDQEADGVMDQMDEDLRKRLEREFR